MMEARRGHLIIVLVGPCRNEAVFVRQKERVDAAKPTSDKQAGDDGPVWAVTLCLLNKIRP
jgi:hypothetical protein